MVTRATRLAVLNAINPEIIFPEYALPEITYTEPGTGRKFHLPEGTKSVMHQRMGFYITRDERLLTLAFYSYSPDSRIGPNRGQGLGRVVREVYKDGSYGPIYFIRYNRHAGWNETNTRFPFFRTSTGNAPHACASMSRVRDSASTSAKWN